MACSCPTSCTFRASQACVGTLSYQRPGGAPTALAVAHRFVPHQADGWAHAIQEVSRFFDRVASAPEQLPPPRATVSAGIATGEAPPALLDAMGGYLQTATKLGQRTGELHASLAADDHNPAFAPEPFVTRDLAMVAARVADESRPTFEMLERLLGSLPEDARAGAGTVLAQRRELMGRMLSLSGGRDMGRKIRVHGDYHLGQVLWAEDDFYVLDFEGEPDRPLDERRAKQSPLKDVAGMVRSYGYAASAGLRSFALAHPMDRERLEGWATLWHTWASASFLHGYLDAVSPAAVLPPDRAAIDMVLGVFILEKALYELRYELNHRPDWVSIPLSGILELLGR